MRGLQLVDGRREVGAARSVGSLVDGADPDDEQQHHATRDERRWTGGFNVRTERDEEPLLLE